MDISLEEFDTSILSLKNICLIIGDSRSGRSTLIKDIIVNISEKIPYGIVCSTKDHISNFYSVFLNTNYIYSRYSTLIYNRCFSSGVYLVLDDYYYNKSKYNEIFTSYNNTNIFLLISLNKLTDFLDYNYIFICNYTDINNMYIIYEKFIKKFNKLSFEQFIEFKNICTNDNEILVINCNSNFNNYEKLFYFYKAFMYDDFKSKNYYD